MTCGAGACGAVGAAMVKAAIAIGLTVIGPLPAATVRAKTGKKAQEDQEAPVLSASNMLKKTSSNLSHDAEHRFSANRRASSASNRLQSSRQNLWSWDAAVISRCLNGDQGPAANGFLHAQLCASVGHTR